MAYQECGGASLKIKKMNRNEHRLDEHWTTIWQQICQLIYTVVYSEYRQCLI